MRPNVPPALTEQLAAGGARLTREAEEEGGGGLVRIWVRGFTGAQRSDGLAATDNSPQMTISIQLPLVEAEAGAQRTLGSGAAMLHAVEQPRPTKPPEPAARPSVVSIHEGMQLHLSDDSATGYRGVRRDMRVHPGCSGFTARGVKGTFGTALAAAIAYAQRLQREQREAADDEAAATEAMAAPRPKRQCLG